MRSDEELMFSYVKGDEAAFRELFQRYAPILLRLLQRTVGRTADAQDLTQQTFLQLHRARHDFRRDMRLRPWVMTIALNLARDVLRRRGRRPELEIDEEVLAAPAGTASAANADERARVRRALEELPTEQREVIELHWFEDLPFNDIAVMLGCSAGAVRVRAHRGYVNLRKTLGSAVAAADDDEPAAGDG